MVNKSDLVQHTHGVQDCCYFKKTISITLVSMPLFFFLVTVMSAAWFTGRKSPVMRFSRYFHQCLHIQNWQAAFCSCMNSHGTKLADTLIIPKSFIKDNPNLCSLILITKQQQQQQ
jgi:hypothetical protein